MLNSVTDAARHYNKEILQGHGMVTGAADPWCIRLKDMRRPSGGYHYIFLKKAPYWFMSFNKQFPHLPAEYSGIGQTITLATLVKATQADAMIGIVLDDGKIYGLEAKAWYEFTMLYNTKRQASNSAAVDDLEASVPAKMLKRLNSP